MLREDASMDFRSQGHLAQFGGSLQLSKALQSHCGLQGAVLKASASFFAFSLPVTFLSKAGGKRSRADRPWGRSMGEAEKGRVRASTY